MKIAIIDYYTEAASPHKDPISIPRSLAKLGVAVELVTRSDSSSASLYGFNVSPLSNWLDNLNQRERPDCVIAISRFEPKLTGALNRIKKAGIPLIVKGDTDGSLGYPLSPNYLRTRPLYASFCNIFRHIKWRAPIKRFVYQKLQHIQIADKVVYESPGAGRNLCYVLMFWHLCHFIPKLHHIPNAVADSYTRCSLADKVPYSVVAVGRWEDRWCKGSDLLANTIVDVCSKHKDAAFYIIGSGGDIIKSAIGSALSTRVNIMGSQSFESALSIVSRAQVILVPSRLESFSLASAEALCTGATIVACPLESLTYLAGGGAYGSLARNFSTKALAAALLCEFQMWTTGARTQQHVANSWRMTLNEDVVGQMWYQLIQKSLE